MTHRQVALFGGISALILVFVVAATATIIARNAKVPQPVASTTLSIPSASLLPTSTLPLASSSTSTKPKASSTQIGAHAFIASDLSSGAVLASRKSLEVWPMASLTKLMTATVALNLIGTDEQITIVPVPGGNPSKAGIQVGETFAMRDVLKVMVISSSNEAAESLAAHVGREKFLMAMNAQAAAWGLDHTSFQDASGLSPSNHSTAREIVEIAKHVFVENPEVFKYTKQSAATVYAQGTGVAYTALATHQLVRDPGFLGGKTGYTDEARGNLLSLFQVGAHQEALVVLGSDDRFGDTRRLLATLKQLP